MADRRCTNCGNPESETYELRLQSTTGTEVPLCEECHEALDEEFIWG